MHVDYAKQAGHGMPLLPYHHHLSWQDVQLQLEMEVVGGLQLQQCQDIVPMHFEAQEQQ